LVKIATLTNGVVSLGLISWVGLIGGLSIKAAA